ncbi:MAG: hypothetical protein IPN06_12595 [Burkholderiales bacterium]|nr:hypothetical protein [Burkholderiales bacterium]
MLDTNYSAMVTLVVPQQAGGGAVEARAHWIASGDQHLHSLGGNYQGVRIVTPAEAVGLLQAV